MADLKAPNTQELAPLSETATLMIDPFLKVLQNPDSILNHKGAGDLSVYAEVLRDDQVKSTFQQRRLAVVAAPWNVEPGADDAASKAAAEALEANLKAIDFDRLTDRMLYAVFFGYGVAEIMWAVRDGMVQFDAIRVRDRNRFRFGVGDELFLRTKDWQFREMPPRKFWTLSVGQDHDDNPYGVGLAHWLYWPAYFKRADIKFWLIFLEKFGQPTAMGKLPAGQTDNKTERAKLLAALRAIATEAAVVIPEGAEVELLEASRSGAADYAGMHAAMNAAISKIVLSQTMTTDNGSSRSQATVHEGVRDLVVKADADLVCESFNRGPVRWWTDYNFPGATPPKVWRDTEPATDLTETAKRDELITKLGYEPTEEYILETYGPGWEKKKPAPVPPGLTPGSRPNPFGATDEDQEDQGDAANFAENLVLAALKASHRGDQQALADAAQLFANQYEGALGQRVQQLLDYAEDAGDYDTFRKHLVALFGEQPPGAAVDKLHRATFFARLMGAFRAQR